VKSSPDNTSILAFGTIVSLGVLFSTIYLGLRWSLTYYAIILDNMSIPESFDYSWKLSSGWLWEILGVNLLLIVPMSIISISIITTNIFGLGLFINSILDMIFQPVVFMYYTRSVEC
jgi:hypothetical protein